MKKILLSLFLLPFLGSAQATTVFSSDFTVATGFTVIDNDGDTANWGLYNSSASSVTWGLTGGFAGSRSWNGTGTPGGALTPDNFLITPAFTIPTTAGATTTISFKLGSNEPTAFAEKISIYVFPATATGAAGIIATTPVFTRTLTVENVQTALTYTAVIPATLAGQSVKIALRHYDCTDQNLLYFDDLLVTQSTLGTDDFSKANFAVYPNPATDVIKISNVNNLDITNLTITDINGRTMKQVNTSIEAINVSDLNSGIYFLKIKTAQGEGVTKFVKN